MRIELCVCVTNQRTGELSMLPWIYEVQIDRFNGSDHEFDVLKLLFRRNKALKKPTVTVFDPEAAIEELSEKIGPHDLSQGGCS